jgi:hypothetical protein
MQLVLAQARGSQRLFHPKSFALKMKRCMTVSSVTAGLRLSSGRCFDCEMCGAPDCSHRYSREKMHAWLKDAAWV